MRVELELLEIAISRAVTTAVQESPGDMAKRVAELLLSPPKGGDEDFSGVNISAVGRATEPMITEFLDALHYTKQFPGQMVPARPTAAELSAGETATGPLRLHGGVVLQAGPFRSIWARVGCDTQTPWRIIWEGLRCIVTHTLPVLLARGEKSGKFGALYIAISQGASQAVDLQWLSERGFRFHHHRESTSSCPSDAELVYYCWPGPPESETVPPYATSIEGVVGLCLSPDEQRVLLCWERGKWQMAGGHVETGEGVLEALSREIKEEVGATVDSSYRAKLLGGHQQAKSHDALMNTNFQIFAVRLLTDDFRVDGVEVKEARWFSCDALLSSWVEAGRPSRDWQIPAQISPAADKRNINMSVLKGIAALREGRHLDCVIKSRAEGPNTSFGVSV